MTGSHAVRLQGEAQAFRFTEFFEGEVEAWGIFVDLFGVERQRLKVHMTGTWQGLDFHLGETFEYDTGESDKRKWIVRDTSPSGFTARGEDCPGPVQGVNGEGAIHMSYDFNLKYAGRTYAVHFDDKVFRLEDGRAYSKVTMKKFGVTLGRVLLLLEKKH